MKKAINGRNVARISNLRNEYDQIRNEFEALQNFLYHNYMLEIESNLKSNPKQFWNYVALKRANNSIPSKMSFNELSSSSDCGKAELFARFFRDVYRNDTDQSSINDMLIDYNPDDGDIRFSVEEVRLELLAVDTNKGTGPDKINPIILKRCAHALARPFQLIFNRSLAECVFPKIWKSAIVKPIFKQGSKSNVSNYRSIVKLPTIGKFFESLINKRIKCQIANKISIRQHGFVNKRSTSTNIMEFADFALNAMEGGNQIDVLYTDFLKAFDRVVHRILIRKLMNFELHSNVIKWIWSYLRNRKLRVVIGGYSSSSFDTNSGVPQGSHLGPTLFTMFIDDLAQESTSRGVFVLLFADDTKIFSIVNNARDAAIFQSSIDRLHAWCIQNELQLNVSKCKIMSFYRRDTRYVSEYGIGDVQLERVEECRDLGITMDRTLSFNSHVDTITAKAYASLGFLKRMCSNMHDPYTLKSLYCAHVRSVLEYACVIWHPQYQTQIDRIESIQRKFTRFALRYLNWNIDNNPWPTYETRCKMISIESLERRRMNANIFFIYDLLRGNLDAPQLLNRIVINEPVRSLRSNGNELIRVTTHRTNYGQNAPLNRMSRLFNRIDDGIRRSENRNSFHSLIKSLQMTPN